MRKRYWLLCGLIVFGIFKLGEALPVSGVETQSQTPARLTPSPQFKVPSSPPSIENPTLIPRRKFALSSNDDVIQNPSQGEATKFINGNRIALRSTPSPKAQIIDRLDTGKEVFLLDSDGQWSHVRDTLTQKEGWVASRFLRDNEPKREKMAKPAEPKVESMPTISPSVIIQRIIAESVANYPGSCACPYSTDRRGRRCGNRSAYSKPGGYAPICFAQDVTKSMVEAYQ